MSRNYKFRNSESASRNVPYERIRAVAGVLQIALPEDLRLLQLESPSRRAIYELEVAFKVSANDFTHLSKIEMNLDDAHQLVKEVYGIDLPKNIGNNAPGNSAEEITRTMTHSTLEQSYEFYKKATKYNIKK
ncbi:hypothetical protein [Flavobacterium collinsii]|uniref:Uncharacterized protein n=1 Tax=Flavobacterium collinsii TaxID=1114861 RepID=A0A9W4TMM1_9FLAO|nr:hypothetical protein [Flavobacterium collinsii]CAI2768806.1 conserved protein of unknown function [Flavobacterium collinsii]